MKVFSTSHSSKLTVRDPDFEKKIRESFKHQGVMKALGGQLIKVEPAFVELHVPFSDATAQQHGFFHGGMIATAADTASGYATYTILDEDEECLSAEFKVNFLSPGRGEKLISRGRVLKAGRNLVVAEAVVSVVRDGEEIDCALMIHTLSRVKHVKSGVGKIQV